TAFTAAASSARPATARTSNPSSTPALTVPRCRAMISSPQSNWPPSATEASTTAGYPSSAGRSGEERLHHATMSVGQPIITPAVAVGQSLVVEPEQMQDGGVQVVHV